MRRVISVFLKLWPVELRLRRFARINGALPDKPFVVVDVERQTQVIKAVCPHALSLGLEPSMALAQARAIQPILHVAKADAAEDAKALNRLATWFLRFSPFVAADQPDGLWIDATGVAHLFGGEAAMLKKITARLARDKITAMIAMAETPGAAWALARYGRGGAVEAHDTHELLKSLPIASLRIAHPVVNALQRLGLRRVGDLMRVPRSVIPVRFGEDVLRRLDQALGREPEPISAMVPPQAHHQKMTFEEPISTRENLERATQILCERICVDLEKVHEGARRLDLLFYRTDSSVIVLRVGTSKPNRDARHISKMLIEKLDTVDPGFGIEVATLTVWLSERVTFRQISTDSTIDVEEDIAQLADRLSNRIGMRNVFRLMPVESDIPERAVKITSVSDSLKAEWLIRGPRPLQLFSPPEPVDVTAMLPDHPPLMFRWRGSLHKVQRADGPERIQSEWWRKRDEIPEVRDYFRVENERGERYWLYRDSRLSQSKTYRWYMHGIFA